MPVSGGCQCGAVRYTLALEHIVVYACHCRECQKQSASAFALSVPARIADLSISGPLSAYRRSTDSGAQTTCWFCSDCGTRIYHRSARSPEIVTLKGGTLDDTSKLTPAAHLWVSRKQAWLELPELAPVFETQPDDLKAWRDRIMQPPANRDGAA